MPAFLSDEALTIKDDSDSVQNPYELQCGDTHLITRWRERSSGAIGDGCRNQGPIRGPWGRTRLSTASWRETGGKLRPAQVPSLALSARITAEGIRTDRSQLLPIPLKLHSPRCQTSASRCLSPKNSVEPNSQGQTSAETGSNKDGGAQDKSG